MTARWRGTIAGFAAGVAIALAGCGAASAHGPGPVTGVLPPHAIAGLPQVTKPLTATDVQKDSSRHDLAARMRRWGYRHGWQRTFQGESRRLTLVVSRSLTFRTNGGASDFVAYLERHINAFYPFAVSKPLEVSGQAGWLIKPPLCACHMAQPVYVGLTRAGRQVRWLEINGPRATSAVLTSLLSATGP